MAEPATTAEKRVTFGELFFDLVFVVAITQVSALLHEDHSWAGVGRALVVFVPIYWAWVGTTIHANTHDVDNPLDRLGVFAVGLCGLFMALAVPGAYEERGALFGGAYLAVRILLAALIFRGPRMTLNPFSIALFVTGPLVLAGGLLDGWARLGAAGVVGRGRGRRPGCAQADPPSAHAHPLRQRAHAGAVRSVPDHRAG